MTVVEREALPERVVTADPAPAAFRVETGLSFADLAPDWLRLQREGAATPYQTFDWVQRWSETVGAAENVEPMPVAWRDRDGRIAGILPLGLSRWRGLRIASFMGGKHANFAMGLFDRSAVSRLSGDDVSGLLRSTARNAGIDLFQLSNQPYAWGDFANPLALLPLQQSPASCWKRDLGVSGDEVVKSAMSADSVRKLRRKERRLGDIGAVSYIEASTEAEAETILEAFLVQKAKRFAAQGITDPFASEAVRDFLRASSRPGLDGAPLALFALRVGDRIAAVFGGVIHRGRFSGMFGSFDDAADLAKFSPGELLIIHLLWTFGERGLGIFDLGAGDMPYKKQLCPDEEPLFDSILPMTAKGRAAAWAISAALAAKGAAKRSPIAGKLIAQARRMRLL